MLFLCFRLLALSHVLTLQSRSQAGGDVGAAAAAEEAVQRGFLGCELF
ncbi:MAG: hypothetical protein Q8K43_12045 [Sulfurimicrobium sp.]|nr:hypothetical protein [Sulfurimicrobium sp.]